MGFFMMKYRCPWKGCFWKRKNIKTFGRKQDLRQPSSSRKTKKEKGKFESSIAKTRNINKEEKEHNTQKIRRCTQQALYYTQCSMLHGRRKWSSSMIFEVPVLAEETPTGSGQSS